MAKFLQDFDMNKLKTMVNKVQNVVMQYTEYEAKVRDATNNDPWGTAATTMMEIATATNNYQYFQDIMNTVYKRLLEPAGADWRHNYKGLQLLEFLIINGSPQVIDNAKRHIYEIKALENYHYVDEKRKDQVRHRATKILELLASDDLIREARQKANENRAKYTGVSNLDMNRTGGFTSSAVSSYQSGGFDSNRGGFQDTPATTYKQDAATYKNESTLSDIVPSIKKESKPIVANLLDFDDFGPSKSNQADDFGDFESAPSKITSKIAFQSPIQAPPSNNFAAFQPQNSYRTTFAAFQIPQTNQSFGNVQPLTNNDDFGDFETANTQAIDSVPKKGHDDAFSKLVSLDSMSLAGDGKKQTQGASLNSLQAQQQGFRY